MAKLDIEIARLAHADDLPLPEYATAGSAGCDLLAAVGSEIVMGPMERQLIPAGICIALPEGYEAQIRPRSGLAFKHGISVVNAPGTIDSDYRGEIKVLLINLGDEPFTVTRGMRVAQMVIAPVTQAGWKEVRELNDTVRSGEGFGSTGTHAKKRAVG